jgi:hypothetical protein
VVRCQVGVLVWGCPKPGTPIPVLRNPGVDESFAAFLFGSCPARYPMQSAAGSGGGGSANQTRLLGQLKASPLLGRQGVSPQLSPHHYSDPIGVAGGVVRYKGGGCEDMPDAPKQTPADAPLVTLHKLHACRSDVKRQTPTSTGVFGNFRAWVKRVQDFAHTANRIDGRHRARKCSAIASRFHHCPTTGPWRQSGTTARGPSVQPQPPTEHESRLAVGYADHQAEGRPRAPSLCRCQFAWF